MARNLTRLALAFSALLIALPPAGAQATLRKGPVKMPKAVASAMRAEQDVRTPSGIVLRMAHSTSLQDGEAILSGYAAYLDGLTHGAELSTLSVYVARASELAVLCDSEQALACYSPDERRMYVPGEPMEDIGGLSAEYLIAHEYGHHIAASRSHAPFDALTHGPKYWASHQRVCAATDAGYVAPGDQGQRYQENPGEAWAETYAQLHFPAIEWYFADRLKPGAAAFAAARRDVERPWSGPRSRTFTGALRRGQRARRFELTLRLDGAFKVELSGPRRAQFDLEVTSGKRRLGRTRARGASDRLSFAALCRERSRERVRISVIRRSGGGPFSLDVSYAG